jgi:hypothetical protein
MIILFLPPNFDYKQGGETINKTKLKNKSFLHNQQHTPQSSIERIHKSQGNGLIVYQIDFPSSSTSIPDETTISSQVDPLHIRELYLELHFQPIDKLFGIDICTNGIINIFGIVSDFSEAIRHTTDATPYSFVSIFDFDLNKTCRIKLWRGLAVWINSFSIGCRVQIRNLLIKDSELASTGATEIFLLGHGHLGIIPESLKLSSRHENLLEKEREILNFLSYESLRISARAQSTTLTVSLKGPIYLEWNGFWYCEGLQFENCGNSSDFTRIVFNYFDAKTWNSLLTDDLQEVEFKGLRKGGFSELSFVESSTICVRPSTIKSIYESVDFKSISWKDLLSSSFIQYGIYRIEGILSPSTSLDSSNSFGNLTLLDDVSTQIQQLVLKDATDPSLFVYPAEVNANIEMVSGIKRSFLIKIRTILNDHNVKEVVRKLIFIIE